ncbi:4-(cytidine 5'-diphospho)-2-C-methyl-D-erythritol kinase [Selenomonadales bacterium OttesenSCG-928-I06]|nr:4-(cytidine 5'-diphospho)-2-C-methyl-D-erythritol kinase [Selenomonadales bacterium OttesenSCG-928-I06]
MQKNDILSIKAYAKINLAIDVIRKRPDNYHEVKMIMQSIDLFDIINLKDYDNDIKITSENKDVPLDETNLAYKAAQILKEYTNISQGVQINIDKKIPIAAGLAGGSADAAAVLIGLNKLWNLNLDLDILMKLGATLGSDVPFCLKGGTILATGRGEILTPLNNLPDLFVILVKPKFDVSTAWVYNNFARNKVKKTPNIENMIIGLKENNITKIVENSANVLESVTIEKYPEIEKIKEILNNEESLLTLMSGSGPTVFALIDNLAKATAIVEQLKSKADFNHEIFLVKTTKRGYFI